LLLFDPEVTKKDTKLPAHFAYGKIHIALEVEEKAYAIFKDQLIQHGIEVILEQHWKNNLYSFYFRDPDGHLIEIVPEGLWEK
jgi:catechol 2,3-dioxygenase-like lactoylglutathione lyase family enzyme